MSCTINQDACTALASNVISFILLGIFLKVQIFVAAMELAFVDNLDQGCYLPLTYSLVQFPFPFSLLFEAIMTYMNNLPLTLSYISTLIEYKVRQSYHTHPIKIIIE